MRVEGGRKGGRKGGRQTGRVEEAIMEDGLGERERGRNVLFVRRE